jgi:hypothetical protein
VIFGVGTTGDKVEINNNLKTLKSYDSVARNKNNPAVMFYSQYGQGLTAAEVNQQIQEVISGLAVLFSRQNKGMDNKDLENWQNFVAATGNEAKLVSLHMIDDDSQFEGLGNIISVASLAAPETDIRLPIIPDYRIRGASVVSALEAKPIHFVVSEGRLLAAAEEFEKSLIKLIADQDARPKTRSILNANDKVDDRGFVW